MTIEYAGGEERFRPWSFSVYRATLTRFLLYLMVDHCNIHGGGHWGVWVHHDTTISSDIDNYAGNTDGDFNREP